MSFEKFQTHYEKIYGPRWSKILEALRGEEIQYARWNIWAGDDAARIKQAEAQGLKAQNWIEKIRAYKIEPGQKIVPQMSALGVLDFYVMDPASVVVAMNLTTTEGDRVLDMCAAPGGKTLVIFEKLRNLGDMIANDTSEPRRERMKKVVQSYIPRLARERLFIQGKDASLFGVREPDAYQCVLLDAPCSGERHLVQNADAMKEWSTQRTEGLSQRQYSMISSAYLSCVVGGQFVYSTCAISPTENDEVVDKLLERRKDGIQIEPVSDFGLQGGEKTRHGMIFMPDQCGFGPLYMTKIKKIKGVR